MSGPWPTPKKVTVTVLMPDNRRIKYEFSDIESVQMEMETLTRELEPEEYAEAGFPLLRRRKIIGGQITMALKYKTKDTS